MGKAKVQTEERKLRIQNKWFIGVIAFLTIAIYINTARNNFSLDDHFVTAGEAQASQGFKAIPEIFTTLYSVTDDFAYGYRPLVRASYTIDHELWDGIPYYSHGLNVLLYLIGMLLLFSVLKRIFNKYNAFLPFIITLLYLAHPLHTEVVASLKSRDELLNLIFCLLALQQFIKWADFDRQKHLILGSVYFLLALISKETAASFLLIFPLTLYFFTDIKPAKLWIFTGSLVFVIAVALLGPQMYLPEIDRDILFYENPLAEEGIANRIGTGMYVLLLYLKKLVYPYPMLYYYGYNMVPVVGITNVWSIISILFYLGIFVYAMLNFRKNNVISYGILVFLITIAMFTNILMPVPGIMGDRFLFFPTLGFSIVLGYLIFRMFSIDPQRKNIKTESAVRILGVTLLILIPFSALTIDRNKDWRTAYALYSNDMKYLDKSVKAHNLLATELVRQLTDIFNNPDPGRIPPPVSSQKRPITEALDHYKRAIELYPDLYSPWNNMGTIHYRIMRKPDLAIPFYEKTIKLKPDFPNPYFNLGDIYSQKEDFDKAIHYYNLCFQVDSSNISPLSKIANIYFRTGQKEMAIELNEEMIAYDEGSYIPYMNLGYYYSIESDTSRANIYLAKAVEKGFEGNVYSIISQMYLDRGDRANAYIYDQKARELEMKNRR